MNTQTTQNKYSTVAIVLHWVTGLLILGQLTLGLWMIDLPKTPPGLRAGWFNIHKSLGILIAVLVIVRILWRLTHRPPALPQTLAAWQKKASHVTHHLLYVLIVVAPLSGFLSSAHSKYPIKFFGLELPKLFEPDANLKDLFSDIHLVTIWLLIALITVHILAALKHRFIDKDDIFQRMSVRR